LMYSVKLRAEKNGKHISGAEKIVDCCDIKKTVDCLLERTKSRLSVEPDSIILKMNAIKEDILIVDCIRGKYGEDKNTDEARKKLNEILVEIGLDAKKVLDVFYSITNMRGAVLLDIDTYERLELDKERGVRVTCFDFVDGSFDCVKDHIKESKCLASKVIAYPNIIGEICVTDDVNYTFGYFASKELGLVGVAHIKELHESWGGRVFLFDGKIGEGTRTQKINECIKYLEQTPVLVRQK